jgi:hypothetical protein
MNKMKRYKILSKQKVLVKKTFVIYFAKGLNKSWLEFHALFMNKSQQNEVKGSLMLKKSLFLPKEPFLTTIS